MKIQIHAPITMINPRESMKNLVRKNQLNQSQKQIRKIVFIFGFAILALAINYRSALGNKNTYQPAESANETFIKNSEGNSQFIFSTFLGGDGSDEIIDSAVNPLTGSFVFVGQTSSSDFPTTLGAYQETRPNFNPSGTADIFLTGLMSSTHQIDFSTFLGTKDEEIDSISNPKVAIDSSGNIFITGDTLGTGIEITDDSYQKEAHRSFIVKMSADGSSQLASTYFGDVRVWIRDIAVHTDGTVYIYGMTSGSIPTTENAYDKTRNGTGAGNYDLFVAKFNNDLSELLYSTYLGGTNVDYVSDSSRTFAIKNNGAVVGAASTESNDFPTTENAYAQSLFGEYGNNSDIVVFELDVQSGELEYSSYYGGQANDESTAIVLDSYENIYLTGWTRSRDFPLLNPIHDEYIQPALVNAGTSFLAKLTSDDKNLAFSTFLEGIIIKDLKLIDDELLAVVSGAKEAFVTITKQAYDDTQNGNYDSVLKIYRTDGQQLCYSSYIGSEDNNNASALFAIDKTITMAGHNLSERFDSEGIYSHSFPLTDNAIDQVAAGRREGLIFTLDVAGRLDCEDLLDPTGAITSPTNDTIVSLGQTVGITVAATDNEDGSGVKEVSAWVNFGEEWTLLGKDSAEPYSFNLTVPEDLTEYSEIQVGIHVEDNAGNYVIDPSPPITLRVKGPNPLIFIPGIMGSDLDDVRDDAECKRIWPNSDGLDRDCKDWLTLDPEDDKSRQAHIQAVQVSRTYTTAGGLVEKDIYGEGLRYLQDTGNYILYDLESDPDRITESGCDTNQSDPKPTLFEFPYDWRLSNADNAKKLAEYIEKCVKEIHGSNIKIDILAHSMGGLVTRRYITDNELAGTVDNFVSVGSPYLGTPLAYNVLDTGTYDEISTGLYGRLVKQEDLKRLAEYFPGAHQLLPSKTYHDINPQWFVEKGYDFNGDGKQNPEGFTYEQIVEAINAQFTTSPMSASQMFHSSAQDNWSGDQTGINYFHVVGDVIGGDRTIVGYEAIKERKRLRTIEYINPVLERGDGTVSILSALRNASLTAIDAETCLIRDVYENASHSNLMGNEQVFDYALSILKPELGRPGCPSHPNNRVTQEVNSNPVTGKVRIYGATMIVISDSNGNRVVFNSDTPVQTEEDIDFAETIFYMPVNDEIHDFILPTDRKLFIEFQTTNDFLEIEYLTGNLDDMASATRFIDVVATPSEQGRLMLNNNEAELLYDFDSDGVFEMLIEPSVEVSGELAGDLEAPEISFVETILEKNKASIEITAQDSNSGVKRIYYSLDDGVTYSAYSKPITVELNQIASILAYAEDNVLNRSHLYSYDAGDGASNNRQEIYLPVIVVP